MRRRCILLAEGTSLTLDVGLTVEKQVTTNLSIDTIAAAIACLEQDAVRELLAGRTTWIELPCRHKMSGNVVILRVEIGPDDVIITKTPNVGLVAATVKL